MLERHYRQRLGRFGEQIAKRYYRQEGNFVLAENYYCRYGEIDLILLRGQALVFVEVKTRTSADFGLPEEAVTDEKLEHMAEAAEHWMDQMGYQGEFSLEIAALLYRDKRVTIYVIPEVTF